MAERCVRAYNIAGRVTDGLRLSAAHLSEEDTRDIYMPLAEQMRQDGQLRKAEQIYIGLGEPDEAISMYKVSLIYRSDCTFLRYYNTCWVFFYTLLQGCMV